VRMNKKKKKFYTTGDVARYCEVDVNTVKRWIRHSNLNAFSTPSGHYRVTRENFIEFLDEQGFTYDPGFFGDKLYSSDVLIIDEDPIRMDEIRLLLRSVYNGINIDTASNGFDGYRKVHPVPPRIIIIDMKTTDVSEIEFLKIIRSKESFQDTPILVITKSLDKNLSDEIMKLQVNRTLESPISENDLRGFCDDVLLNMDAVHKVQ